MTFDEYLKEALEKDPELKKEYDVLTVNCRHYDKENGWCKKLSDWSEPMPVIVHCPKSPCEYKEELAPCPFCGKKAEMKTTPHIPNGTDYTPRCTDPSCCGRLSKKYSTRECAVYHWNMRACREGN